MNQGFSQEQNHALPSWVPFPNETPPRRFSREQNQALLSHLDRNAAQKDMSKATEVYEARFDTCFETLTVLTGKNLTERADSRLFAGVVSELPRTEWSDSVFSELRRIANLNSSTVEGERFNQFLVDVYGRLDNTDVVSDDATLMVAPRREGAALAQALGWLTTNKSATPEAKRIPFDGGLLVGLAGLPQNLSEFSRVVIVDGAVASGATVMAIIDQLGAAGIRDFRLLSVHGTEAGISNIIRLVRNWHAMIRISIGRISGVLNNYFYAIDPTSGAQLVGDLGERICGE